MVMAEAGARARGQTTDTRPHYPWSLGIEDEPAMIIEAPSFIGHYGRYLDIRIGLLGLCSYIISQLIPHEAIDACLKHDSGPSWMSISNPKLHLLLHCSRPCPKSQDSAQSVGLSPITQHKNKLCLRFFPCNPFQSTCKFKSA